MQKAAFQRPVGIDFIEENGAGERIRTLGPRITKDLTFRIDAGFRGVKTAFLRSITLTKPRLSATFPLIYREPRKSTSQIWKGAVPEEIAHARRRPQAVPTHRNAHPLRP